MQYLCLMYCDGSLEVAQPGWDAELPQTGSLVSMCALDAGQPAITIKTRNGNVVASDGPLVPSEWLLHTCALIDARDLNDAIRLAGKIPGAELACIEIRPIAGHITA